VSAGPSKVPVANWLGATFDADQFEKFRESKKCLEKFLELAESESAAVGGLFITAPDQLVFSIF
jgi:hypothetical protein